MKLLRFAILSLAATAGVLGAAGPASAQDIRFSTPQTLEFQVRVAISPDTQRVYCYQMDALRVIGNTSVASSTSATVALSLPDPVIRCASCNLYGCSSLSPNAAVVYAADPLDLDGNGRIDVRDMLACYSRIRDRLY